MVEEVCRRSAFVKAMKGGVACGREWEGAMGEG